MPREPLEIERVHRVAELEQHVVRDVDDIVDGADAGCGQPLLHPRWRRRDLHFSEGAAVTRAAVGILDRDPQIASLRRVGFAERREARHLQRRVVQRRDLARDAKRAEAVGTVRGDLEIDHRIVPFRRRSWRRFDRRDLEARHVQV